MCGGETRAAFVERSRGRFQSGKNYQPRLALAMAFARVFPPDFRGARGRDSLCAFFEGRGFTAQMRENFACEME